LVDNPLIEIMSIKPNHGRIYKNHLKTFSVFYVLVIHVLTL